MIQRVRRLGPLGFALAWSVGLWVSMYFDSEFSLPLGAAQVAILAFVAIASADGLRARRAEVVCGASEYEILGKLGEGGMGEVFRARQVGLGRLVALKSIKAAGAMSLERARFRREARVLSSLSNPHTINVFDAGIRPDGSYYYVMELLDGFNLEEVVQKTGPLPPARVIHILTQATLSLAEAHHHGLVHRDLKPANLMACRYGGENDFVKVLDFGLAKVVHPDTDGSNPVTLDDALPGTPAFIAPEAILGSNFVDGRSDIYSLGALGHYLLTGRYLFEVDTPLDMMHAQLKQPAVRASSRSPHAIPPRLDELLLRCLQKDPSQRPQRADELLGELEQLGLESPWTRQQAAASFAHAPLASVRPEPHLPGELAPPPREP